MLCQSAFAQECCAVLQGYKGKQHSRVSAAIAGIVRLDLSKPCLTTFECDFRWELEKDLKDLQAMMASESLLLRYIIDNGLKLQVISTGPLTTAEGTALWTSWSVA